MKGGPSPRVSVVVPNYNYARFLIRRMDSILNQTFTDLEVIFLDDASTDDSRAVVQQYAGNPRVRMVFNETNTGSPFTQWNRGVALARGEYVWIAEADDFAEADFLERLVPLLDGDRDLGLVYCQSRLVDEDDRETGTMLPYTDRLWPGRWAESFRNRGRDEVARYLVHRCTIPNASAVLFRRSAFLDAGGAEAGMRLCGDWMTYVRILKRWDLYFLAANLNHFRTHAQAQRTRLSGDPAEIVERYMVLEEALNHTRVRRRDRREALESRMYLWVNLAERNGWSLRDPRMAAIRVAAARVDPRVEWRFFRKSRTQEVKRIFQNIRWNREPR